MRVSLRIALHDLRMSLGEHSALVWMFVLPLVFSIFFGMVTGGSGDPSDVRVQLGIKDEDDSVLSHALVEELGGDRLEIVDAASPDVQWMRRLTIPDGFEEKVSSGERVILGLEISENASAEATLAAKARIFRAITRLIGSMILDEASPEAPMESARALVEVDSRFAGSSHVIPTGFSQSFPGNSLMFVMLVALSWGAASLGKERETGMLRRIATAPISRAEIVMGKIGGRFLTAALQVTVLVLFMAGGRAVGLFQIGGNASSIWLILMLYAACVAPLGVAVGSWFSDPDRASSIGVMMTIALAAVGGCWWPLEIVGGPLRTAAWLTPTAWAMRALSGIISFGNTFGEILPSLGVVAAFGIVFSILATRLLRIE